MPKAPKLIRVLGLICCFLMLISCTCLGIPTNIWMQGLSRGYTSPERFVELNNVDCTNARLTSPRSGLPDGVVTIYWNEVPGANSYTINVYSGGNKIKTFTAYPPATNLQADVGFNAIGGENPFTLEFIASYSTGDKCTDSVTQDREWHVENPPQIVNPPVVNTPTCIENPGAPYC